MYRGRWEGPTGTNGDLHSPILTDSTFGDGSYNFAAFLFLIEVYRDTLVPASLVGFCTTCAGLILSSYIGGLVDRMPRLEFVRGAVGAQKVR